MSSDYRNVRNNDRDLDFRERDRDRDRDRERERERDDIDEEKRKRLLNRVNSNYNKFIFKIKRKFLLNN
jgi:hypothetical protein